MSERKTPPGFSIYREAAIILSLLPDADAAAVIKAAANFFLYSKETKLTDAQKQVYESIRDTIGRDAKRYTEMCEINKEIAIERERRRKEARQNE